MKYIQLLGLLLVHFFAFAQAPKERIQEGVRLHKEGKYQDAIALYQGILTEYPNDFTTHYELAMSYMAIKDYPNSTKHCDIVIESNFEEKDLAYLLKGAMLDYSGKPNEALQVFRDGIKHNPENHRLHYSVALTSFNQKLYGDAEKALHNAIEIDPFHASSHMLLTYVNYTLEERVKTLLSAYFFLLLEPQGNRANQVFPMLEEMHQKGVSKEGDKNISVQLKSNFDKDEFGTVEMFLGLSQANLLSNDKNKTDYELFAERGSLLFSILGDQKKDKTGFYWNFYVDFYKQLTKEIYLKQVFFNRIYTFKNLEENISWLNKHDSDVEKFFFWLENFKFKF